jgi:hypothetical protein
MVAMKGGKGVSISAGPGFDRQGAPPFREISNREPAAAVALLLEAGANANASAPDGATALHQAIATRNVATIRALTQGGAKLDARNADGLTALDLAKALQPADPNANPFGPKAVTGASPEEVVAALQEALQAAGAQAGAQVNNAR